MQVSTIIPNNRPRSGTWVTLGAMAALGLFTLVFCPSAYAQDAAADSDTLSETAPPREAPPAPVTKVVAADAPNDAGGAITLAWEKSLDDGGGRDNVAAYILLRGTSPAGPFDTIGTTTPGTTEFADGDVVDGVDYYYVIEAVGQITGQVGTTGGTSTRSGASTVARASAQWLHMGRINSLIAVLLLVGAILYYISRAKAGDSLFIRKIAGLDAVDEAVGRATEMGRKIFYIPGIQDMNNVQTIAGVTILGRVAKLAASYDAKLDVPVPRSLVMVAARETVKEAYFDAGRPDAYHEDMVHYLTDDQFGYAAGVDGMFVREKPATIFYMGAFFAESLILAETGNSIGAIQIAGTAMPAQLPFFVAACDYTLIGEELFAASAYLTKEPRQLGSLKGQDVGKFFILLFAIAGIILATVGLYNISPWFLVQ